MTGTFKINNPYNAFLLFLYGLLLKLPIYLRPHIPITQQIDGFLYKYLLQILQPLGNSFSIIYPTITFLLLFTQAISFNKLVNNQRLMQHPNYLTGMSYLLITSLFTEWNILSAPLIVNTFIIWIWARMSNLFNSPNAKTTLFNLGIVLGICTFLNFPSLAFIVLIIFGLALTRPFNLAEWLIALLGILTPYYFLLAWVFLTDKWQNYHLPAFRISTPIIYRNNWAYAALIIVLFTTIIGLYFIQKNYRKQLIQTRKSWELIFLYLGVAIIVPFINATHNFDYWILCAVPLSAILSPAFFYPTKKWISLSLHWLMVAFVVALNYFIR